MSKARTGARKPKEGGAGPTDRAVNGEKPHEKPRHRCGDGVLDGVCPQHQAEAKQVQDLASAIGDLILEEFPNVPIPHCLAALAEAVGWVIEIGTNARDDIRPEARSMNDAQTAKVFARNLQMVLERRRKEGAGGRPTVQ